jgi:hypothetical protein
MNTNPENLDAVRKLMAVKRHETPPPAYFRSLSGTIASRIERGECQLNLLERISANFVLRPAFAYAFAIAAGGTFMASVIYSGKAASSDQPLAQESPATAWEAVSPVSDIAAQEESIAPLHAANWLGNTNPGAAPQTLPSLFTPQGHAVTVSYVPGN